MREEKSKKSVRKTRTILGESNETLNVRIVMGIAHEFGPQWCPEPEVAYRSFRWEIQTFLAFVVI